ncbi:hypothetical protein A2U01_0068385, partial [Trifolium medium]|nr:hypothetical protein [Trifolium medium]
LNDGVVGEIQVGGYDHEPRTGLESSEKYK